jgi:hypothetical protein
MFAKLLRYAVAMGVWANHGGGYSYRLCKNVPGKVSEQCFQDTPLKFAEDDVQWLQHINGTRYQIAMTKFTSPAGTEWARIPYVTLSSSSALRPGPTKHKHRFASLF